MISTMQWIIRAIITSSFCAIVSHAAYANPVFAPSMDTDKMGVFGELLKNKATAHVQLPRACHAQIPYPENFASIINANSSITFNQNICVQIKPELPKLLAARAYQSLHTTCMQIKQSILAFGVGHVTEPAHCPTKNIVASCRFDAETIFVYDTLRKNSHTENLCRHEKGVWRVVPTQQRQRRHQTKK